MSLIGAFVLASFLSPVLLRRLSSKRLMVGSTLLAVALYLGMWLVGFTNLWAVVGFVFLTGLTLGVFAVVQTMITDAVDNVEATTGVRNDGISFSMLTFVAKIMNALVVAVFGAFVVAGYQAGVAAAPAMQQTTYAAITLVPGVSCLVSIVPFVFYRPRSGRTALS